MKILSFGSMNLDNTYHVAHFVQPGETLSSQSMKIQCGGKGLNQSIAIAKAGVPVYHAGKIGDNGGMLADELKKSGADIRYVKESAQVSGHAIIQVDQTGQNCILLYSGANHDIDCAFVDDVLADFSQGDLLLLQNEINNIPYIMEKAHEKGMLIALNPSPISRELMTYPLQYVKWFFLNEIEGEALSGKTDPEQIADTLLERYPGSAVVLTLGKRGVFYKDANVTAKHGIYQVKCVDTTGAGDTFTGYFIAGLSVSLDIPEILRRASVASSIAVSRAGAAASIPTLAEVLAAELTPA